jgi:hypothetical protein
LAAGPGLTPTAPFAEQAGANDPKALAQQLVLLYDGAGIGAWMDRDPGAELTARTMAAAIVEAAIPEPA